MACDKVVAEHNQAELSNQAELGDQAKLSNQAELGNQAELRKLEVQTANSVYHWSVCRGYRDNSA